MGENCPSRFGGTFGGNGVRKIISPVAGSAGLHVTRLFPLDQRTVFPVFAMFAMTTMADSCTLAPVSQVTSTKAG